MAGYDQESQSGPLLKVLVEDETETSWMLGLSDKITNMVGELTEKASMHSRSS
jgi:hypothetical protein